MTAINILVHAEGAVMLTDAVGSRPDHSICWIGSKVIRFPHFAAVAAVTSKSTIGGQIAHGYLGGASVDFDDMVSTAAASATMGLEDHADWIAEVGDAAFDIHMVGYSAKAGRFEAYTCSYEPGRPPETFEAGRLILQPGEERVIEMLEAAGISPPELFAVTPELAFPRLAAIMPVQRQYAGERGEVIGGFQEATILSRECVFSRVLEVWPDRVTDG